MEKSKIDRVIDAFRSAMYNEFGVAEEGMVANPPGGSGGFSGSSNPSGPTAGYDSIMKIDGRNKYVKKYIKQLLNNREKRARKKAEKRANSYNPYFTPTDGK
jgi:hypothetical protein|tara:strand:+ start:9540 stop:9845 length:306 start_codon:yes stop_codon:yes gene_type:complete